MISDKELLDTLLLPLRNCRKPSPLVDLGNGAPTTVASYQGYRRACQADTLASHCGIGSQMMYKALCSASAHGMALASLRQGMARLLRALIYDAADYPSAYDSGWRYKIATRTGGARTIHLDARIDLAKARKPRFRECAGEWVRSCCRDVKASAPAPNGAVFRIELGSKGMERKAAYTELDVGAVAWSRGYLPVLLVDSGRRLNDALLRHQNSCWKILSASKHPSARSSLFAFSRRVLGFEIDQFLESYAGFIESEVDSVMADTLGIRAAAPSPRAADARAREPASGGGQASAPARALGGGPQG